MDWCHLGSRAYWAVAAREQEGRMMTADEARSEVTGVLSRRDADLARIRVLATQRIGAGLHALVEELGDLGFSWRDVARVAGIAPPVLRRWRRGEPATGGNGERLAMLVALCEVAGRDPRINNAAGRLEAPLSPAAPATGIDLVASDRFDLALRLLTGDGDAAEITLDKFDPGWRERYATAVEVFVAPDGRPGEPLN